MSIGITAINKETGRFSYQVERRWSSNTDMFGGATFGVLIEALEAASELPLLTASAQFIQTAQLDKTLDIETRTLAAGKLTSQMQSVANQDGKPACIVAAAMGALPAAMPAASSFPVVPAPDACPPRTFTRFIPGSFTYTLDVRNAGADANGCQLWARWPDARGQPLGASLLAVYADHPPYGISLARGAEWYGLTLDSVLRMAAPLDGLDSADWILVNMQFNAAGERFAHCSVELWSATGTLLAIGGQAMRLRRWQATPSPAKA
jgi:acyl-CoA thioesterase